MGPRGPWEVIPRVGGVIIGYISQAGTRGNTLYSPPWPRTPSCTLPGERNLNEKQDNRDILGAMNMEVDEEDGPRAESCVLYLATDSAVLLRR